MPSRPCSPTARLSSPEPGALVRVHHDGGAVNEQPGPECGALGSLPVRSTINWTMRSGAAKCTMCPTPGNMTSLARGIAAAIASAWRLRRQRCVAVAGDDHGRRSIDAIVLRLLRNAGIEPFDVLRIGGERRRPQQQFGPRPGKIVRRRRLRRERALHARPDQHLAERQRQACRRKAIRAAAVRPPGCLPPGWPSRSCRARRRC